MKKPCFYFILLFLIAGLPLKAQLYSKYELALVEDDWPSRDSTDSDYASIYLELCQNNVYELWLSDSPSPCFSLFYYLSVGEYVLRYDTLVLKELNSRYEMKFLIVRDGLLPIETYSGFMGRIFLAQPDSAFFEPGYKQHLSKLWLRKNPLLIRGFSTIPKQGQYESGQMSFVYGGENYVLKYGDFILSEGTVEKRWKKLLLIDPSLGGTLTVSSLNKRLLLDFFYFEILDEVE